MEGVPYVDLVVRSVKRGEKSLLIVVEGNLLRSDSIIIIYKICDLRLIWVKLNGVPLLEGWLRLLGEIGVRKKGIIVSMVV